MYNENVGIHLQHAKPDVQRIGYVQGGAVARLGWAGLGQARSLHAYQAWALHTGAVIQVDGEAQGQVFQASHVELCRLRNAKASSISPAQFSSEANLSRSSPATGAVTSVS